MAVLDGMWPYNGDYFVLTLAGNFIFLIFFLFLPLKELFGSFVVFRSQKMIAKNDAICDTWIDLVALYTTIKQKCKNAFKISEISEALSKMMHPNKGAH